MTHAGAELQQFIERIERVNEERKALADDLKDIYAEVKGRGFDSWAVKEIVKLRSKDASERAERETILELYKNALGMR